MTEPVVRLARPDDLADIALFTQDTFEWGDYVADAFEGWLGDPDTVVFVVPDEGDRPIALGQAVRLSPREVWLGGARVHPDHRRRGLGAALNEAAVDWGRQWGAVVAGLITTDDNTAARSQVAKLGYRAVAHWFYATRDLELGEPDPAATGMSPSSAPQRLERAPHVDVEPAYMTWSSSELATVGHGLIPISWKLRRMSIDDLAVASRQGHLFEAPAGWVLIERNEDAAWVPWLVTIADDAYSFLRAITARVAAEGATAVSLMLPYVSWLTAAAEQAGYRVAPHTVWHLEIHPQIT